VSITTNIIEEFGANVRRLRESKGLSQQTIADVLHIGRSAVCKMEDGARKSLPSHSQIEAIAFRLGVDPAVLLGSDKFITKRYTDREAELMENHASTKYIKAALAQMELDLAKTKTAEEIHFAGLRSMQTKLDTETLSPKTTAELYRTLDKPL